MADGKIYLQHTAAQIDEGIDKAFAAAPQANTYTKAEIDLSLQNKVDKIPGKELSSNDFTDSDLQKLNDVSSEVQEARGTYTSMDDRLDAINTAFDSKADLINGVIPISQIPPAAIEKEVPVVDDAARFALTTADVQLGDTVRVIATNKMYLVVDTAHLDTEAGYQVYVAGRAAEAVADQYGNTIDTTYATKATTKTAWEGTAAEYTALTSDDYDLYFVEEST